LEWIEVNERFCKMLGYSESELFTQSWKDLTHPDDWPQEQSNYRQMMDKIVRGYVLEKRLIKKDKQILKVNLSVQCLRREDGSVDCILALVQNINSD
jgi:PAS domain S-box-containing protein